MCLILYARISHYESSNLLNSITKWKGVQTREIIDLPQLFSQESKWMNLGFPAATIKWEIYCPYPSCHKLPKPNLWSTGCLQQSSGQHITKYESVKINFATAKTMQSMLYSGLLLSSQMQSSFYLPYDLQNIQHWQSRCKCPLQWKKTSRFKGYAITHSLIESYSVKWLVPCDICSQWSSTDQLNLLIPAFEVLWEGVQGCSSESPFIQAFSLTQTLMAWWVAAKRKAIWWIT